MKNTPVVFISVIFALLAGCSSIPNRVVPNELGIKQVPGKSADHPAEYVFCDIKGGAWGCEEVTPKTSFKKSSTEKGSEQPITSVVQKAIKNLSQDVRIKEKNSVKKTSSFNQKDVPTIPPITSVYFGFDSSVLSASAKTSLLDVLKKIDGKTIELHGYTDNVGAEKYNNWLGFRRANKVKEFFTKTKSSASQIDPFGHGLCCYSEPNGTEEQRAKNRRVEIYIVD